MSEIEKNETLGPLLNFPTATKQNFGIFCWTDKVQQNLI